MKRYRDCGSSCLFFFIVMTIAIHTNGLVFQCNQLPADGAGSWYSGKANDWQWSVKDFGISWGIAPNLGQAIREASSEIDSINRDFNVCPYQIENDRLNPLYHPPLETAEF